MVLLLIGSFHEQRFAEMWKEVCLAVEDKETVSLTKGKLEYSPDISPVSYN